MTRIDSSDDTASTRREGAGQDGARTGTAPRLALPVPLLLQLCRPLNTLDDVQALAAQLASARARGCF